MQGGKGGTAGLSRNRGIPHPPVKRYMTELKKINYRG